MKMLQIVLSVALGFALGCTYKELIGKGGKISMPGRGSREQEPRTESHEPIHIRNSSSFDLSRINDLFEKYKIDLKDIDAFPRLLKFIWQRSYMDLLKLFIEQATSPAGLARILKEMNTPNPEIIFSEGSGKAFLTEEALHSLIEKEGVEGEKIPSVDDKVRFLWMLSYGKGVQKLRDEFGEDFQAFLETYEQGRDAGPLYEELIGAIRSRYEFLS